MKNRIFLLISWIIFVNPHIIEGAVFEFNMDESYFDASEMRNPFLNQLPKKEEEKPAVPVVVEHPFPPTDVSRPVRPPTVQPLPLQLEEEHPQTVEEWSSPVPSVPEIPLPDLIVTGLIWDTARPQAIVNDEIVGVGDTILGARIIAIKKAGIDVLFNEKSFSIGP